MASRDLSDTEATVLRAVQAQNIVDLYDLSQEMGTGPRTVQDTVRRLATHDLVHVSGRRVRCTRAGDQWVREHS